MPDNVEQIKERLNIIDVISGYLRLVKAGVNYKALCPFHNEKTPSFMVSPARQAWHCFGCNEGGDIFTFVEKIEGVEFIEALKILAEKAGIELKYSDPKLRSEKDRLYEICEASAQFFSASLNNPNLRINPNDTNENPILDYLHKRGLQDETISEWRLGYAPDSWDSLLTFLKTKGYKESEIEKTGLIIKVSSSKFQVPRYHDRFRNRLMFPIFDVSGKVIAFSGRLMSEVMPSKTEREDSGKYINSPESVLFNKSKALYGLDRAKNEIRKENKAVLVEGQMDLLLSWQDGIKNIIASSGTALTEDHLVVLKRLTRNLVLAFDMDDAGFRATKRGVDLAQSGGFNISVLDLEAGKDPADFVKEKPGELIQALQNTRPIMSYYFNQIFKKFDINKIDGKKIVAITLLSEIKRLPSAIERSGWIRELSLKLGVSERDLEEEMSQLEPPTDANNTRINAENFPRQSASNQHLSASKSRKEILSERLLALLLKNPELTKETAKIVSILPPLDFEILSAIVVNPADFSAARSALQSELRPRLDFLYLAGDWEIEKLGDGFNLGDEIKSLVFDIEREHYKEALSKIEMAIKNRENISVTDGGQDSISDKNLEILTKEFQNISQKLLDLDKNEENKI